MTEKYLLVNLFIILHKKEEITFDFSDEAVLAHSGISDLMKCFY